VTELKIGFDNFLLLVNEIMIWIEFLMMKKKIKKKKLHADVVLLSLKLILLMMIQDDYYSIVTLSMLLDKDVVEIKEFY